MKYFIIFLLTLFTTTLYSQQKNSMEEVQTFIKEIQHKYSPDKRTALFNINSENETGNNSIVLKGKTNLKNAKTALLKKLNSTGIKFSDKIEMLPSNKLGNKIYAVINLSVASLRTHPKHAAEMATQALLGSSVKVLDKKSNWYLVQTPDKYIAWVPAADIALMNKTEFGAWEKANKIIYTEDYGFSIEKSNSGSSRVSDLVIGDILIKLEAKGNFIKVEYPDKRIAFIPTRSGVDFNVWLESRKLTAGNIINSAKKFMGIPYLWGGTSAKAMDCSGFTKTVFFLNGVLLPRDASQQVNVGVPVDTKNGFSKLQPGDLLFFGTKATDSTKEKVTHVGIYIGNDEFIHESGRVQINSFDSSKKNFSAYRLHQFLRAKRILTSVNKNGVVELSKSKAYNP